MYILEIIYLSLLFNSQAFENIYSMLRPNGNILVLLVGHHHIFEVIKVLAQDARYSSYIGVNIIACNYIIIFNYQHYIIKEDDD